jgi:hypothetical protein
MQKLAIFGDSYAKKDATDIQEKSWHNFINEYDVTNFGEPGSDLWFSYNSFLNNHSKFDKIIFLVTSPHRIKLSNPSAIIYPNQNYTSASIKLESATGKEYDQYKTIVDYYNLIHDKDKEENLHRLVIENIKLLRNDAIVYPCFDSTWSTDVGLYNVTKFEDSHIGLTDAKRNELYRKGLRDSRACHMTEDNNKIIASLFLERLNGSEQKLILNQLAVPKHTLNYYYQSSWH